MKIDKKEFKKIYYKCLEDILAIRPIDEALKDILAVHDYDFKNFGYRFFFW